MLSPTKRKRMATSWPITAPACDVTVDTCPMRSLLTVSAAAALLFLTGPVPAVADEGDGADRTFTIEDPRITESSGLAASRIHPGVYWTHNDSDDGPYVYAVDSRTGKTVATITMQGVGEPRDVEAISLGPDGNLYVGDIGDNLDGSWDHVWIYRFPEPKRLPARGRGAVGDRRRVLAGRPEPRPAVLLQCPGLRLRERPAGRGPGRERAAPGAVRVGDVHRRRLGDDVRLRGRAQRSGACGGGGRR